MCFNNNVITTPDNKKHTHPNWITFTAQEITKERIALMESLKGKRILHKINIVQNGQYRMMVIWDDSCNTFERRGDAISKNKSWYWLKRINSNLVCSIIYK